MIDLEKFSEWMKSAGVPQQAGDAAIASFVSSVASPEAALKEIATLAQGIAALVAAKDSSLGAAAIALGVLSRLDRMSKDDEVRNDALNGFLCFIAAGYRMQIELLPTEKEEKPKVAASPDPRLN